MNFFEKIFRQNKITCPRCMGKGNVDEEDIKRLGKELKWLPGKCAYCNGIGKVSSFLPARIKPDNTYLTTGISRIERRKLLFGDESAFQRANSYDAKVNGFIRQVEYLSANSTMNAEKIADFFLIEVLEPVKTREERQKLIEFIEKIIAAQQNG